MSELVRRSVTPLFDRLADTAQAMESPLQTPAQLAQSIGRDLSRLMNTRSPRTLKEFFMADRTTLDYGIPDFTALSPQSPTDCQTMQSAIAFAVASYEPRLQNVSVVATGSSHGTAASISISGLVTIYMQLQPVRFDLQLDNRHGGLAKAT